ncbi:MAG: hypothetical protein ACRDRK_24715 [Pseudonocardia sp.]
MLNQDVGEPSDRDTPTSPAARAAIKKVADRLGAPVAEDAPDHVRRRRPDPGSHPGRERARAGPAAGHDFVVNTGAMSGGVARNAGRTAFLQGAVVLLSPPLAGSWLAAARCSGRDELTAALALLEPGAEPADIGKSLAGWRALAELIPDDPAAVEFGRGLLPRSWSGVTATYGSADRTVCGRSGDGFSTTTAGDGHVTFAAARIDGRRRGTRWYRTPTCPATAP